MLLSLLGQLVKEKGRMASVEDRTRKEPGGEVSSDRRETITLSRDEEAAFISTLYTHRILNFSKFSYFMAFLLMVANNWNSLKNVSYSPLVAAPLQKDDNLQLLLNSQQFKGQSSLHRNVFRPQRTYVEIRMVLLNLIHVISILFSLVFRTLNSPLVSMYRNIYVICTDIHYKMWYSIGFQTCSSFVHDAVWCSNDMFSYGINWNHRES